MTTEREREEGLLKQRAEVADKLWSAANVITGYGVVQAVALAISFGNENARSLLMRAVGVLVPSMLGVGLLLGALVFFLGRHEAALRAELGADAALLRTVAAVRAGRLWVVGLTHGALAVVIFVVGLR